MVQQARADRGYFYAKNWRGGVGMLGDEKAILMEIAGKVGRLEAGQEANIRAVGEMASSVNRLVDKMDKSDDIAREADQSARSAHLRINGLVKIVYWAGTSLILGMAGLLWKGWGH